MGKRKGRVSKRKPRTSRVVVGVGEPVVIDRVGVDPRTSQVFFWSNGVPVEFTAARVEISYERKNTRGKGDKILARAFLDGDQLWLNPNRALEGFDYLFAIDTNMKR